jgi:3'-5' exonuclease
MARGGRPEQGSADDQERHDSQTQQLAPRQQQASRRHGRPQTTSSPAGTPSTETNEHDTRGYLGESAPPKTAPSWKRRLYIDRPADLAALATDLASARVLAIDAEFSQVYVRGPDDPAHRLALLQLAIDNDARVSYVVDSLRLADLSPLQPALENPGILKLFHGIGSDARVLATRGLIARHTLDLEAVSRSIFGQRESGLQAMLLRACNIRLDKSLQRADWSRRPLTPAMVAYAARDAEMTLALYDWLDVNYAWAVALHETPADEPPLAVAAWIAPYLDGARPRPAFYALAEAGIVNDIAAQERDLREALVAVRHPIQRARVMRLITDLELAGLAPDLDPYLSAQASEERAGAARAAGRLRARGSATRIQPLLDDPVQDVRQAARLALENLAAAPVARIARSTRSSTTGSVRWTSEPAHTPRATAPEGWQAALRASFGISATPDDAPPDE